MGNFEDWASGFRKMWNLIPDFTWNLFLALSWGVMALTFLVLLWGLGESLFWNQHEGSCKFFFLVVFCLLSRFPLYYQDNNLNDPAFEEVI
ncbi:MAG: hypothetical protein ACFFCQ_01760 [Promethearchaeota archaeon]